MFEARGALHLNVLMNISDVPLQVLSVEHLRTERAMLAHIIMNFFDVSFQGVERQFFPTSRALYLDYGVDHLHVLGKHGPSYLFLALWAFSCVAHVSFPNMAFYSSRVDHLVTITTFFLGPMDAFDMLG